MKKCISIQVFGKVHGVWFRGGTHQKALELGIKGTVQNRTDGTVYIEAEGEEAIIEAFVDWCKVGPPHANVERIEQQSIDSKDFQDFQVVR